MPQPPAPSATASALEGPLAGLRAPWQPSQQNQGDTRHSDPLTIQRLVSLQRDWRGAFTGAKRERRAGVILLWRKNYAKQQQGPSHSFCPRRPRVTLAARKVSQGRGPRCLGFSGGSWDKDDHRQASTPSRPWLPFRPSTPAKWPKAGPAFLPPCLCSHWALPLEGVPPPPHSTHSGPAC